MERLCWSLEKIMLARQGCLAEGLPIDYGFFLIFPERALLIFLEAYEKKKEVPLHFVLLCAKNPEGIFGCL